MKISSLLAVRFAGLAVFAMLSSGLVAQGPTDPASTAPTTATSAPADTMAKGDIKSQRRQQKRDEAAARANAKAAKATAKSKEANDKALQAQEKAGQVTQTAPASTPPPAAPASTTQSTTTTTTTAPPQ